MTNAQLLTPEQAADRLNMPEGTLRMWRQRRTSPAFVRVGRHVRYRAEDVDAWVAGQRVEPAAS